MTRESKTFQAFDYLIEDEAMHLHGDPYTLNMLKSYLGGVGVEAAFSRNGTRVDLDIRSGASPDYVKQMLEEWAG
jgi:hypothetical protein